MFLKFSESADPSSDRTASRMDAPLSTTYLLGCEDARTGSGKEGAAAFADVDEEDKGADEEDATTRSPWGCEARSSRRHTDRLVAA